jgi:hypothetical protein
MITLIYKHSMFKSTQLDNQKGKNNIPTEGYYVVTIYGHWKGYFITTSLTWLTWLTHEPIGHFSRIYLYLDFIYQILVPIRFVLLCYLSGVGSWSTKI